MPSPWVRDGHSEGIYRALDEISLSGWDGLDLFSGGWASDLYESWGPGQLRALLSQNDLDLAAGSLGGLSYRAQDREREAERARRAIDVTADDGGTILLMAGGRFAPESTTEGDYVRLRHLRHAAPLPPQNLARTPQGRCHQPQLEPDRSARRADDVE
jgi:sugar phosphate isomerase/epimerase